ncbi:hypothetical protein FOQG_18785 [Fusarium oxysporum f. sp. raphani 54005]|uniref:Uncharacterized protein n=1 Tax=Fusarium oxysporum f. sp. raphani 54005 TaxID=1089458 RepID=X0B3Z3_FUSOX|nr:hypothetical protein FOQG_18785 [Fusarium oxysporum f. sp. raphani 54005]
MERTSTRRLYRLPHVAVTPRSCNYSIWTAPNDDQKAIQLKRISGNERNYLGFRLYRFRLNLRPNL